MIKVDNLHKSFLDLEVLKGINYEFPDHETTVILGSSGSGKSTLLRCLNRLEEYEKGAIFFNGKDIKSLDKRSYREKIGMVFQSFNLFENMTALENITYALKKVKGYSEEKSNDIAYSLLKKVNLSEKDSTYPGKLSGGQKQRVAIARSLAMNPDVLLFDEPTSALDPETVNEVLEVIKNVVDSGMTCIIVTHEMRFAKEVSNNIIFMDEGKVLEASKTKDFFKCPKTERAKQFIKNYI